MSKIINRKITYIDLFAGCGGLSEGFLQTSNYEALAHIEWEKSMINTLRNRLVQKWNYTNEEAYKRVIHFDLQKTSELIHGRWSKDTQKIYGSSNHELIVNEGLKGLLGSEEVDLIIGGPPCQAYSIAGRAQDKDSMKNDYRNFLFESFVKVVDELKPSIFVFENVPGILSACPGNKFVTERIFNAFKEIGYDIREPKMLKNSVYTSSEFGVPQKRKRVIIIGVKSESEIDLESIYNEINLLKGLEKEKNVRDAIEFLPKLVPLKKTKKNPSKNISHKLIGENIVKYHEPRFHNDRDIKIFREWLINDMNKKSSKEKIAFYNNLMGKNSNHVKYRNLEWDKPSPTIVAHLYKDGLMFIHPDIKQARTITVKEAALLQSFPYDFEFIANLGNAYKMIGNAVPPKMAMYIASAIAKKMRK